MSCFIEYKGYHAKIEYSFEDGCFVGEVVGIKDIIVFHGNTINEIKNNFHDNVEDYIELCKEFKKNQKWSFYHD